MAKTNNNSLKLQRAVRSLFYDYQERNGCLGTTYAQAACSCDNALQMWRGPKGDKGDQGPQGPKGDNAGSFLVSAEFVVDPAGQPAGSYLKLVLIDVAQQEQVVYVNLSELEDVYSGGNGIDITSMVIAAKLGAGLTFDNQGNITSAYQFCDGLDETSNVVTVKLDASNNILGFAGSGCKGLTATVGLAQSSSGVNLVLTGASGAVLSTIPLEGGTGITVQKNAQTGGFTWLVDFSDVISGTAGNNLTISNNKLYVGDSALTYTVGDGVFTLTNASGGTSTVTLPTVVRSLDRADLVCEGANAPYLRLTFKRDNGQNLYQDVDLSCLASALDVISDVSLDVQCDTSRDLEPIILAQYYGSAQATLITQSEYEAWVQDTSYSPAAMAWSSDHLLDTSSLQLSCDVEYEGDPPVAYAASVELVSNNDSFWFAPNTDVTAYHSSLDVYVPLSALLAAGEEGYKLSPPATTDPDYSGNPAYDFNIPDRTIRVVTTVDTSGAIPEYTLTYYWDNGISDKPVTDLVITNAAGDETRVDLNPALNHVGGDVLTIADTSDREPVALHTYSTLPRTDSGAPDGYSVSMNLYPSADVCDNSNTLTYLDSGASDGVYTQYVQSGTITHFAVSIEQYVPVPGGTQYDYTAYHFDTSVRVDSTHDNACIDVDGNTSVADLTATGVVVYGHDNNGKRIEELSLYLTGELVEDGQGHPGLAIRAYRLGTKKVLRLGPSCSSDIPLADLGGISGAALDVQCNNVTHSTRVPFEYFNQLDILHIDGDSGIGNAYGTDSEFTVTVSNDSGYGEISLVSRSRQNADGDNEYVLEGPGTFEDLIANSPVLMTERRCSTYSGIQCGLKVWVSCVSNGNSSYTFTFTVGDADTTESVLTTTDLVLTDTGGNETRVDMKPLLAHIGGTVQNMPVGGVTSIPVLGTEEDVESSTVEPGFYVHSGNNEIYIVGVSDTTGLSYEATIAEGKVSVCTSEQIKSIGVFFSYFDNPNPDSEYFYVLIAEGSAPYDMQDILDAGDEGVELSAFPDMSSFAPIPDAPPVRIRATYTHVSDAVDYPDCYTFELFGQAFALALCLAPSCDPCIDLTPAIGDAITSVSGTVSCGVTVTPFEGGAYINGEYSDASDNVIYGISESVSSNAQVTFELPQGTATLFPTVWIADPNDSNMSYSYVFLNGIPVSELTVGARFCSDERLHGYTPQ